MSIKTRTPKLSWSSPLTPRKTTNMIVVHHSATLSPKSAEDIHLMHQSKGWSGIGYHYYIRTDGTIEIGRPLGTVGAHCSGHNSHTVGICLEGWFDEEDGQLPTQEQIESLLITIHYILDRYPKCKIVGHRDLMATACPGFDAGTLYREALNNIDRTEVITKCRNILTTADEYRKSSEEMCMHSLEE